MLRFYSHLPILALVLGFVGPAAQQSLSQPTAALSVQQAQQHLLEQTVSSRQIDRVPDPIQADIVRLKEALGSTVDSVLLPLPESASSGQVQAALTTALPGEQIGSKEFESASKLVQAQAATPVPGLYGSGLRIKVLQSQPSLLVIQAGFVIACGDDNLVLAYTHKADGWRRALLWQSSPYASMDGAYGDSFKVLPLASLSNGLPMLLVVHGRPACSSTTSRLSVTVLQVDPSSPAPHILFHADQPYRRFDLGYLSKAFATSDGFGIRASFDSLDGARLGKEITRRYTVTPEGVVRSQPLADLPADALDEWFQMPWKEAAAYVDTSDRRDLEGLHWRIFKEKGKSPRPGEVTYMTVRSCNDSRTRRQIEIDIQPSNPATQELAYVLFDPASDRPFRFASARPDPACDGANDLYPAVSNADVK